MSNLQTVIIRLAFAKGADEIHCGLTEKGNFTFVGEVVFSEDLTVSHYNTFVDVSSDFIMGSVGTLCLDNNELTDTLIEKIEAIYSVRPVNERGNKNPFVFLRITTDGLNIFNKGVSGEPNRITFLDVENIEVEDKAPLEILNLGNRKSPQSNAVRYSTKKYRRNRNQLSSNVIETKVWNNPRRHNNITVNKSTTEKVKVPSSINQDELDAISKAMKSAGFSAQEIISALKEEMTQTAPTEAGGAA